MARLKNKYFEEIIPAMKEKLGYSNNLAVPKLEKIIINMGVGKALENKRRLECAVRDLSLICGQRPVITKARKSVAGFKLRAGQEIGCKVTLRKEKMYEFLDRLVSIAIPRIRDFRGLSITAFDPWGNFTLGVSDHTIFPEINLDTVEFTQGMNVTVVIRNGSPKASLELLKLFGLPFKRTQTGDE